MADLIRMVCCLNKCRKIMIINNMIRQPNSSVALKNTVGIRLEDILLKFSDHLFYICGQVKDTQKQQQKSKQQDKGE